MAKYVMGVLAVLGVVVIAFAMSPTAEAGKNCKRTSFETELVGDACKKGGQKAAKKAMKKFLKTAKKQDSSLTCKSCHGKLAPDYALKDDALQRFKDLGGK
jgi:hypothetical protein